jgi:hypothetical protein
MTTESKPYLGRCKECDYAVFAAAEDIPNGSTYRDVLAGGVCRVRGREFGRCTNGHKFFPLHQIEGTYSEDFKCDSRCLNAKARKCTCSCGGMNHGRGYAVQAVPLDTKDVRPGPLTVKDTSYRQEAPEREEVTYPKQHIGEVGAKVYFHAMLTERREVSAHNTTLYTFTTEWRSPITNEFLGEAMIKWWKPDFVDDPGFELGEVYKLKAKVKSLDDSSQWGKSTIVTYLEEV